MTLSLEDESTGLLPGSMAATQSLEGQPLAAGHCGMLPHTYRILCKAIFSIFYIFDNIMHIFCSATPGLPAASRPGSINLF